MKLNYRLLDIELSEDVWFIKNIGKIPKPKGKVYD